MARYRPVPDDGETSCITVAIERKGSLVTDDLDAQRYARRHGIHVSGALGVLYLCRDGVSPGGGG